MLWRASRPSRHRQGRRRRRMRESVRRRAYPATRVRARLSDGCMLQVRPAAQPAAGPARTATARHTGPARPGAAYRPARHTGPARTHRRAPCHAGPARAAPVPACMRLSACVCALRTCVRARARVYERRRDLAQRRRDLAQRRRDLAQRRRDLAQRRRDLAQQWVREALSRSVQVLVEPHAAVCA
jgi:hypothetical protein